MKVWSPTDSRTEKHKTIRLGEISQIGFLSKICEMRQAAYEIQI